MRRTLTKPDQHPSLAVEEIYKKLAINETRPEGYPDCMNAQTDVSLRTVQIFRFRKPRFLMKEPNYEDVSLTHQSFITIQNVCTNVRTPGV